MKLRTFLLYAVLTFVCLPASAGTARLTESMTLPAIIDAAESRVITMEASPGDKSLASGLYMDGNTSVTFSGNFVSLSLDFINNTSPFSTGTLRLSLWATTSAPARAAPFSGYRLINFTTLSPLPSGFQYYDIRRSGTILPPPNGTYWVVLVLEEFDSIFCPSADRFCIEDSTVLSPQRTFGPPPVVLHSLGVVRHGTGVGTVSSTPAGINCGTACSAQYTSGTLVTLTASPVPGSSFAGWRGACTGTGPCVVTMNAAKNVGAAFVAVPASASVSFMVSHYYTSILRRPADTGGQLFWESEAQRMANLGASVNEAWFAMASSFYASPEYIALKRDANGFVTDLYNTFFNRPPDPAGLSFWTGQMAAGMPREVVLVSFMFSNEFSAFTQSMFGIANARAEVNAVVDFYRGILSRLPDSGGFGFWVEKFRAAQCQGAAAVIAAVEDISASFADSPEYAAKARTASQFVGDMYNAFLRRGGDLGGVQFWIGEVSSGARARSRVRQDFIASAEFNAKVNAIMAEGCLP